MNELDTASPSEHRLEYQRPFLYAEQFAAIFEPKRYSIIEATTKAGKTSGCIVWLLENAFAGRAHNNYWWVAPVSDQANVAFGRAVRAIPRDMAVPNLTHKTVTLINGAVVWFKSGDKPDSLYGDDVHAAVIDEASRFKEDAFFAIRTTLTATRGPIRIIGNVKGKKNWFYKLARRAQKGDAVMAYHKLTAVDAIRAGVISQAEVEDARATMPEHVFRELYYAEASEDGSNPFGDSHIDACLAPLSNKPPRWWGWDFAKKLDYTVGIALDEDGKVCRFERFQHVPWGETMNRVVSWTGNTPALADSTGVGDPIVEQIQRQLGQTFQGYQFTSPSKQKLMEGLAVGI
ncbi:MAG: terminase large subunit domain-containing protein, partial [Rhizomicrobium sp.]